MVLETEEYGKNITDAALGQLKEQWSQFNWRRAVDAYRRSVIELLYPTKHIPSTIGGTRMREDKLNHLA